MAKGVFGFVQASEPEESVETWPKTVGSEKLIFSEHKKKGGVFLYNCTWKVAVHARGLLFNEASG
jgi:hypothetical protein